MQNKGSEKNMNKKIAMVLIALIGIGLYALPQTMALFAGQHSFYNIDPTGNQVECNKCHGDVQAELTGTVLASTGTKPPHADMKCEFCHRLQIGQSSGDNTYAKIAYKNQTVSVNGSTGKVTITSGTVTRYAIIPTGDYEAGQYPDYINNTDVFAWAGTGNRTLYINGVSASTVWGALKTPSSVSFSAPGAATVQPLSSAGTALCGGELIDPNNPSAGYKNQTICKGSGGTVLSLVHNGTPEDSITTTQFTAFSAKLVTWSGATPIFDNAGSRVVNKGSSYHAASLISCLDCHAGSSPSYAGHEKDRWSGEECEFCHYGGEVATAELGTNKMTNLEAGGFGMGLTNAITDIGSLEVHKPMMTAATPDNIAYTGGRYTQASNAGCVSCHTHVDVQISYTRPTTLVYAANEFSDGNWSIGGFTAIGTNTSTG